MNLIVDIGNTRAKLAIFKDNSLQKVIQIKTEKLLKEIKQIFSNFAITHTIIASVAKKPSKVITFLSKNSKCIDLTHKTKIPFKNLYKTPKTLGVDRIALMAGAINLKKDRNTLVIDAGTCITYDFINDKNEYYGGAIAPGIRMRYNALHHFTENLPLLEPNADFKKGGSTENAIHKGVINGIVLEIEGVIAQYNSKYKNLTVVLTGGDAIFLAGLLKSSIFATPNFLLEGLNCILNYNE